LKHFASPKFWTKYQALPADIQSLADKSFQLLKTDPWHPSLHFKKLGNVWSARVGLYYRAIAVETAGDYQWIWIQFLLGMLRKTSVGHDQYQ
jgi:hypothetical protein